MSNAKTVQEHKADRTHALKSKADVHDYVSCEEGGNKSGTVNDDYKHIEGGTQNKIQNWWKCTRGRELEKQMNIGKLALKASSCFKTNRNEEEMVNKFGYM